MASGSRRHDEVGTGQVARVAWTTTPAAYDIQAQDPTGDKRCCRRVHIFTAGTLVYTGADDVSVTVPSGATVLDIAMKSLSASSTAQNVLVVW